MRTPMITLLMIAILAALGGSANAQMNTTYCGDLAEADCAIIQNADVPASATFNGEGAINVTVADMPYSVGLTLNGSYILNEEAYGDLMELSELPLPEVYREIYGNVDEFVEIISASFQLVDSDLTLSVDVPEELTGGMLPNPVVVDLWLENGVGYVDLAALSFADPSLTGVYGVDFVSMYEMIFADPMFAEAFGEMGEMEDGLANFTNEEFVGQFTTINRLDDVTMNGQTMAVFETVIDYGALFSSDAMRDLMQAQIDMQTEMLEAEGTSAEEIDAMMTGILDAYAIAFDGTTMTMLQNVGLDDSYIHNTSIVFQMEVDTEAVVAAMNEAVASDEMPLDPGVPPFTVDVIFNISQGDFDTVESIGLPEDAAIVPLDDIGL